MAHLRRVLPDERRVRAHEPPPRPGAVVRVRYRRRGPAQQLGAALASHSHIDPEPVRAGIRVGLDLYVNQSRREAEAIQDGGAQACVRLALAFGGYSLLHNLLIYCR